MSITKVNDAQIPEDYTRNPEITKVNDTHKFTNAQILIKLINGNHENW